MKKTLWILTCALFAQIATAQVAPKWATKAKKAVFSIITYDKDNKIKGTGNGFYIDGQGTALSDYSLFEGAERAVIINADGKQQAVEFILGANSMYDVIKFRTPVDKKQEYLSMATKPAQKGETVFLLPYSTQKAATCQNGKITDVDSIGNSFYYTLEMKTGEKMVSCPIMNATGQLVGMIQKNASDDVMESYAIGADYGAALEISALAFNDNALNKVGIRKALPSTEDQALVYLYMASTQVDSITYEAALNDFVQQYPNSADGYIRRASLYMNSKDNAVLTKASNDFNKALEVSTNKADTKYTIAKTIYAYQINLNDKEGYAEWSYDKALGLVREAIQENNQPIYIQLEGDILFAMGNYSDAFVAYDNLNKTSFATPATFYSAAKSKQLTEGADLNEVIALLDSAIVRISKPYTTDVAPYFYERAEINAHVGNHRNAVIDYNTFHDILNGNVNALFYYQREQSEMQCRMYQQALDDINKAVELTTNDETLWAEKGVVHLRVSQLDEAIAAFEKAISVNPEYGAAYRMLGYCQSKKGMKKEAKANYKKAKELGDTVVDQLMEKL